MKISALRPVVLFAIWGSLSAPAYAYLDPATGSIAIQALIGAVATWVMYSRMFTAKVKSFFRREESPGATDAE